MPELPEVETTSRYLNTEVTGTRIVRAEVFWARTIDRPVVSEFARLVSGRRIERVSRRGKFIVIELDPRPALPGFILALMRMSGSFDVVTGAVERGKHEHVILHLDDRREIRFNDARKFGRFYLVTDLDEVTGTLGYEPFDEALTPEVLKGAFAGRRTPIKPLLLDQRVIAGIGNIYADEALWYAGIRPLRAAGTLSIAEITRLLSALRQVLAEAIAMAGTDFRDGVVHGGMYEPKVYGRGGEPCRRCGEDVTRIVLAQRSTHYCGRCQKAGRR